MSIILKSDELFNIKLLAKTELNAVELTDGDIQSDAIVGVANDVINRRVSLLADSAALPALTPVYVAKASVLHIRAYRRAIVYQCVLQCVETITQRVAEERIGSYSVNYTDVDTKQRMMAIQENVNNEINFLVLQGFRALKPQTTYTLFSTTK